MRDNEDEDWPLSDRHLAVAVWIGILILTGAIWYAFSYLV